MPMHELSHNVLLVSLLIVLHYTEADLLLCVKENQKYSLTIPHVSISLFTYAE